MQKKTRQNIKQLAKSNFIIPNKQYLYLFVFNVGGLNHMLAKINPNNGGNQTIAGMKRQLVCLISETDVK